ncbi:Protein of unknown function [Bacillus mycoides]|nr:Protein of unknown function [Bacillus mycoides]SCM95090.1 Protein of unknown function [Bacillus mycoides]
MLIVTFY